MRKYYYDTNNLYVGFTDGDDMTGSYTIVEPASSNDTFWDGTTWVPFVAPVPTFEELRAKKIQDARDYFDEMIENISSNAANFEVSTFEPQRAEWLRYMDDVNASTPYCDMLSSTRGITKAALMEKIGYKVVGFAQIQGSLHGIEDACNAATTEAELDLIVW